MDQQLGQHPDENQESANEPVEEQELESKQPRDEYTPGSPIRKSHTGLTVFLTIIITAIIAGGGVYLWLIYFQPEEATNANQTLSNQNVNAVTTANRNQNVNTTTNLNRANANANINVNASINANANVNQNTNQNINSQPTKASSLDSLDDTWNHYINYKLGFSIKVPKVTSFGSGGCKYSTADGDHSYRPDAKLVPVTVIEDQENNEVYITPEYFYKLTGKTEQGYKSYFSGCEKVVNSLTSLNNKDEDYLRPTWEITVKTVTNDDELEQFIKDQYGLACRMGDKKPREIQSGVYSIGVLGDGKEMEESECFMNFATALFYSPEKQKVINWDLGQAYTFVNEAGNEYDSAMAESLRFQ